MKMSQWNYTATPRKGEEQFLLAWEKWSKRWKRAFNWDRWNNFEGTWSHDRREGRGAHKSKHGTLFKGQWAKDICQKVYEIVVPDAGIYHVETKGFRIHGKGTFKFWDGGLYEGHFKNDKREKLGKYTWNEGDEYEGDWVNDHKEGYGTIKYSTGSHYKGQLENGMREEKGG